MTRGKRLLASLNEGNADYIKNYGARWRFGPYHRQAVRFVGRALERLGARLDEWSWGWK